MKRYALEKKSLENFRIAHLENARVTFPSKPGRFTHSSARGIAAAKSSSNLTQHWNYYQKGIRQNSTMTQTLKSEVKPRPVIRIAGAKDAQAVAALGSKVFTDTFGYSLPAADLQTYLATAFDPSTIAKEAASPHIDLLVACDAQDHVMGFAQLTQGSTEPCIEKPGEAIELQRLYVGQEYHGSGVGRALYMDVEQRARKMGFRTIWLGVWEDNFKAQKVYERFGFERIGTHDFKTGECIQTDWIMSKSL